MIFLLGSEEGIRMIIETVRSNKVRVRYRDENRQRKVAEFSSPAYCFVESKHSSKFGGTKEAGYTGLYGEKLTKITVPKSFNIKEIRDDAESRGYRTWEANFPYINRVMSDRILNGEEPIPNYDHRIWYLDCEWNPVTNEMRVMVVRDSFSGKEYVWFVNKGIELKRTHTNFGGYEYEEPAREFPNEKAMLLDFLRTMDDHDPDVIAGWFVVGADIKQIIERCNRNGLDPKSLSPMRRLRYEYKDWSQPIVGRICIDLMVAVSKLWELKNGKLSGYSLDNVSHELLGEKKVELPDGHDTFLSDLPLYLDYSRKDVELLPKLDAKVNAINYYLSLQHIVQCDIKTTPFITKMFSCLALQDKDFDLRIPTRPQFGKIDYEGADVMDVKQDVYDNVGILDIKAMYHSNASLHNISWETLSEEGDDCGNGTRFSKDNKGLLVRLMDKMTDLRNHYKGEMKSATTEEEKQVFDTMQFACKSLVASMYGVCGDAKYGMYHPELAAAITFTSRQTLDKLKELSESVGLKVLYGHTDSVFVSCGNRGYLEDMIDILNKKLSPIEVQFEKWCDSMILMAKNRYAGLVTWTDGQEHSEKLYIKGIEMKQSRMPQVMKDAMQDIIFGLLTKQTENDVTNHLKVTIDTIVKGEADPLSLCMKGKLDRNLHEYKVLSGTSAGAAWANEYLGKNYKRGSFFKVTLDEKGKYIAFDDPKDIEGKYNIGYKYIADKFLIKKVTPYYEIMGWNTQPLHNSLQGIGHLAWL